MIMNANLKFKAAELQYFNWLYKLAPCFPIKASKVNIISDPRKFYDTLCERFKTANQRISVASLYIGNGSMEKQLLEKAKNNLIVNKNLRFTVLLDYQRGTRGELNSTSLLKSVIDAEPDRCNVCLYQTTRLQASWSKALPSRYNELVGLQHMKLYITDDSVLLSGANCSNDYFQQRQDRYVEIQDKELANFYSELIEEVSRISKKFDKNGIVENKVANKELLIKDVNKRISNLIETWKVKQETKLMSQNNETSTDTWVFPLIQMGEFNIIQDEQATCSFLKTAPEGSQLRIATGYFNLTDKYADTLLKKCNADTSLLMAHPNANGFLGAAGPAGGIPYAYSLIAKQFWQKVLKTNQDHRIELLEYERDGWTFHAKGLWYYPPGSGVPWATLVGSANLGERSVRRDLEAQAAILTVSPDLQRRLHSESEELHAAAAPAELQSRRAPVWVQATVQLFRTYF